MAVFAVGVSAATVKRDWTVVSAWVFSRLTQAGELPDGAEVEHLECERMPPSGRNEFTIVQQIDEGPLTAREHGLAYEIDPAAGYSCGLFLDQRDNRGRLKATISAGQRFLNTLGHVQRVGPGQLLHDQ